MDLPEIDEEFAALIPPLTEEEYADLEKSILNENGCRDPIVVWDEGNKIIDGNHRFKICQKHEINLPKVISKTFESREQVKDWIIQNQLGKRNLTDYDRARLALKLKPAIEEKAKEKQIEGGKEKVSQKSAKPPIDTRKELADLAGVSHDTMDKVEFIEKEATPEQVEQIRKKKKSINKVYREIRPKTNQKKKVKKNKPEMIGEEFNKAWNDLFVAIKNEKALKWKTTDKAMAIEKIQVLLDVIKIQ
jgi:hypothetical protein